MDGDNDQMKILAIETATEACSAAVFIDDKQSNHQIISRFELAPREHTKLILPMMDDVLNQAGITLANIDAIAFSCGPGAFTGLRIATGVAQGIALSIDKPLIPVSTLSSLALQAYVLFQNEKSTDKPIIVISALDARMGEVYWGKYSVQNGQVSLIGEEKVTSPESMLEEVLSHSEERLITIGNGWDVYDENISREGKLEAIYSIKGQYPKAEMVVKLAATMLTAGEIVSVEDAQPVYIRNKVAKKSKKYLIS